MKDINNVYLSENMPSKKEEENQKEMMAVPMCRSLKGQREKELNL